MNSQQISMCEIMKTALKLFAQNGYTKTGIRQIADGAGVSLGLINHYFISKKNLGSQALGLFWNHVTKQAECYVDLEEDPLLFDAVVTRGLNQFMLGGTFRRFYLDSLTEDIFFDDLSTRPNRTLDLLRTHYAFPQDRDLLLLYNRYVPYNIEKTLILKKEEGMFASIPYEDIPYHICLSALERFVPKEEISRADQAGREIVPRLLADLPEMPSEELIQSYIASLLHAE